MSRRRSSRRAATPASVSICSPSIPRRWRGLPIRMTPTSPPRRRTTAPPRHSSPAPQWPDNRLLIPVEGTGYLDMLEDWQRQRPDPDKNKPTRPAAQPGRCRRRSRRRQGPRRRSRQRQIPGRIRPGRRLVQYRDRCRRIRSGPGPTHRRRACRSRTSGSGSPPSRRRDFPCRSRRQISLSPSLRELRRQPPVDLQTPADRHGPEPDQLRPVGPVRPEARPHPRRSQDTRPPKRWEPKWRASWSPARSTSTRPRRPDTRATANRT